jgi:hypothetical protein
MSSEAKLCSGHEKHFHVLGVFSGSHVRTEYESTKENSDISAVSLLRTLAAG